MTSTFCPDRKRPFFFERLKRRAPSGGRGGSFLVADVRRLVADRVGLHRNQFREATLLVGPRVRQETEYFVAYCSTTNMTTNRLDDTAEVEPKCGGEVLCVKKSAAILSGDDLCVRWVGRSCPNTHQDLVLAHRGRIDLTDTDAFEGAVPIQQGCAHMSLRQSTTRATNPVPSGNVTSPPVRRRPNPYVRTAKVIEPLMRLLPSKRCGESSR